MVDSRMCDQITELLLEKVHVEVPSVDTDLMEAGILDSVTLVEVILNLEETFGTKINLEDVELDQFRSVARIAELVENRKHAERRKTVEVPV